MKNEALKIIGLVVFFFVMGVMVGYNLKSQEPECYRVHDTETVSTVKRTPL